MTEFNLSFIEAMEALASGMSIQSATMNNGMFVTMSGGGFAVVNDVNDHFFSQNFMVTSNDFNNSWRSFNVKHMAEY